MSSSAPRQAQLPLDFVIVGASISGLLTAFGLARSGHRVRVFEKAPEIIRHGSGVRLAPNSMNSLKRWGFEAQIRKYGSPVQGTLFMNMEDGKEIGYTEWADDLVKESGSVWCAISYTDFIRILYEAAASVGVKFYTSAPVASVTPPEEDAENQRPFITLEDGRTFDGDIVVGCDGAYSVVRRVVEDPDEPTEPQHTGLISFAGDVPMEEIAKDPYLKKDDIINGMPFWATTNGALRGNPHTDGKHYMFHLFWKEDMDVETTWEPVVPTDSLTITKAPGLHQSVQRLVKLAPKVSVKRWDKWPEVEDWVDYSETVVLVGEAAHPDSVPFGYQNAGNPVESATVFATLFSYLRTRSQISTFLHAYEDLRHKRAREFVAGESETAQLFFLPPGPERDRRDKQMAGTLQMRGQTGWDYEFLEQQWNGISHVWTYNGVDAAESWWVEWGILAERAQLSNAESNGNGSSIRFDTLDINVSAVDHE
ncbi:unnamed protein product [Peniophora sp. CBMAI 1063]|nr:unnamed protein product [Peniophora sp. CBMAI 1063]